MILKYHILNLYDRHEKTYWTILLYVHIAVA